MRLVWSWGGRYDGASVGCHRRRIDEEDERVDWHEPVAVAERLVSPATDSTDERRVSTSATETKHGVMTNRR